jgi:hypothetical protein
MRRAGTTGPPAGDDPADWTARKAAGAASAWTVAQVALEKLRALLDEGKTSDLQRVAIAWAVALDKSAMLEAAAAAAEERQLRLARADAELIVAALRTVFDGAGLPWTQCKPLIAAVLKQAEAGEPLSAPEPAASHARAAIRQVIEAELAAAAQADARALPPAVEVPPEPEFELAEVLTGEVVSDEPASPPPFNGPPPVIRRSRADFSARAY